MKAFKKWIPILAIFALLVGCDDSGTYGTAGSNPSEAEMTLPVTTDSDEARAAFMEGMSAWDMGRGLDARPHFEKAVAADPGFALASLYRAYTGNSLAEFTTNLKTAEAAAADASDEEQVLIEIARKGFDADAEGQLAAARRLVELAPESARAWLILAGIQSGLSRHQEARQSLNKALELAPEMAAAHMQAGNEYLFGEPRDLAMAEQHMKHAIELAPEEMNPHDQLGDVYRAQGAFEKARAAYTEAAKYSGEDGSPYQQRGHVNSFLGDFEAARADYDKSIAMARGNQGASYGVYRALLHVHAGDPAAAVEELKTLAANIDGMNIPEPTGLKLFALNNAAQIAIHSGMTDEADAIVADWTALMQAQAQQVGTDEYTRNQNATIAYVNGLVAIKKGDFAAAEADAVEFATLVEPDANPRKMEAVHKLRGLSALEQGNYAEAVEHLRQGDPLNDIYIRYQLARALEGAGENEEATMLYQEVATWNFNSAGLALVRKDAMAKAGMGS